jgi:hypothetical protein
MTPGFGCHESVCHWGGDGAPVSLTVSYLVSLGGRRTLGSISERVIEAPDAG